MKNNHMVKITGVLVLLTAIISLTVCGKGERSQSGETTTILPDNDGPFTPYAETVPITTYYEIVSGVFPPTGETFEDNFITRFYTEKLNVKFKLSWEVDVSESVEKLNAAVASNDLPDMFQANFETLGRLIKAGQVQVLDEVYEKYASPRLREICEYQEGRGFLPGLVNGKRYALPLMGDPAGYTPMMYIRKDWLDKLGLTVPATMDEFLAVARAFRDRDPDGNGINDTIAFALDRDFNWNRTGINSLANPLGAYTRFWIPDGQGGLTYSSIQPEIKELLILMQSMYEEGLLDKEFVVKDANRMAEQVIAGQAGIVPGLFWNVLFPLLMSVDANPEADWIPVPVLKNKQGLRIAQSTIAGTMAFVVRTGFDHPEALIKVMNLWAEMFHGEYADYFNQLVSTEHYINIAGIWNMYCLPAFFQHPDKNLFLSDNVIEAVNAKNIDLCTTGEARRTYEMIMGGGTEGWGQSRVFYEGGTMQILKEYDGFVFNEFLGAPTSTMIMRTATLDKLEDETFFAVITGESINRFDDFVRDWRAQGGDQITREVNEWYRSIQEVR
jgi:putative aldouronate transport system substrate-binding protein